MKILLAYGGEQNPIVWAMKKYPSFKYIQLYGIWVIINATYWSKSAEHIVADYWSEVMHGWILLHGMMNL